METGMCIMIVCVLSVKEIIAGNIIATRKQTYLGEVRLQKGENIAVFPCEIFHRTFKDNDKSKHVDGITATTDRQTVNYWKYCFHYVTISKQGTTNTTAKFCMPATIEGKNDYNLFTKL